ncbi:flavin reductase family protein [Nocardia sp. NPDC050378]|uniref:flavin reductase family protein n=1 Tax=Nocardia sp. NPDC050378 TaxID=3155400 RepID=UPI0033C36179
MNTLQLDVLDSNPTTRTAALRAAYGCFPSGVTAVCALRDNQPVGIAASSFVAVSMEPPLVAVCVQHTSTTWPRLADRPRLGLSILGADHDAACRQLASKNGDRFAGLDWSATDDGAIFLHEAATWLDCSIQQTVPAGDHDIVLLRVEAIEIHEGVGPLVFHASTFHHLALPTSAEAIR